MGVKRNDEVITVCNSFYATAGAIVACGTKPVFVDSDERYQININAIENAITKKTKVILLNNPKIENELHLGNFFLTIHHLLEI